MNNIKLIKGDCLEKMKGIADKSIDMILCDLPYGTTHNKWDSVIPLNSYVLVSINNKLKKLNIDEFILYNYKKGKNYKETIKYWKENKKEGLWDIYNRIIKDNGVIALFGQTPFNEKLGISNLKMLRYEWIIKKTKATGHLNAKKMPMKSHENVLVFYKKMPTYNPQKTEGHNPVHNYTKHTTDGSNYGKTKIGICGGGNTSRYPIDVLEFKWDTQKSSLHPTQKPVALLEYLIKTYTNEGDLVLDNCMGSGSTGVACLNTNRKFIGIEKDDKYFDIGVNRINTYLKNNNLIDKWEINIK